MNPANPRHRAMLIDAINLALMDMGNKGEKFSLQAVTSRVPATEQEVKLLLEEEWPSDLAETFPKLSRS